MNGSDPRLQGERGFCKLKLLVVTVSMHVANGAYSIWHNSERGITAAGFGAMDRTCDLVVAIMSCELH